MLYHIMMVCNMSLVVADPYALVRSANQDGFDGYLHLLRRFPEEPIMLELIFKAMVNTDLPLEDDGTLSESAIKCLEQGLELLQVRMEGEEVEVDEVFLFHFPKPVDINNNFFVIWFLFLYRMVLDQHYPQVQVQVRTQPQALTQLQIPLLG